MNLTDNQYLTHQVDGVKENLFNALIKHNLQAVALVDGDLRFVTANAAFCTVLGLPGKDKLNQFHISVLPFSKDPKFNGLLQSLVTNELERFEIETSFNALDNQIKYLKLRMIGVWENGMFRGGTLFLEDITHSKENQNLLEATISEIRQKNTQLESYISSNLQLENFAYLASHDMKEPLRMIGNFSQLLEKRYGNLLDESGKEYLEYIVGGVKNMNMFINDLLAYSKLDSQIDHIEKINVEHLEYLIYQEFHEKISNSELKIFFENAPEFIVGSKEKMKTLFSHIIANSIKFSEADQLTEIVIKGEEQKDFWKFEVVDNGIGIKEEFFEKIFLLFKRLHPRNVYSGSGIGLAICKKIIDQHNGQIWVESEFGKGTSIFFTIEKPGKVSI